MCIKLSELKDNDILLADNLPMTKKFLMTELDDIKNEGHEIFTATKYTANLNAKEMLEYAVERECSNMYNDWDDEFWGDVTQNDIADIEAVLNRILSRRPSRHSIYLKKDKVKVDV